VQLERRRSLFRSGWRQKLFGYRPYVRIGLGVVQLLRVLDDVVDLREVAPALEAAVDATLALSEDRLVDLREALRDPDARGPFAAARRREQLDRFRDLLGLRGDDVRLVDGD
jgi:hypothetical protein